MRHSTITERINETHKISNHMLNYLEKQIIIDYHFRGEQEIFEEKQANLKEKAYKLLGIQFYHELGSFEGPVTEEDQPERFEKLIDIQRKLTSDLEKFCQKNNVNLDEFVTDRPDASEKEAAQEVKKEEEKTAAKEA